MTVLGHAGYDIIMNYCMNRSERIEFARQLYIEALHDARDASTPLTWTRLVLAARYLRDALSEAQVREPRGLGKR